jgi:hypothetical protein
LPTFDWLYLYEHLQLQRANVTLFSRAGKKSEVSYQPPSGGHIHFSQSAERGFPAPNEAHGLGRAAVLNHLQRQKGSALFRVMLQRVKTLLKNVHNPRDVH